MKKVLLTDPIAPAGVDILREAGLEVIDLSAGSVEDIVEQVGQVHGWIVRSGTAVDAELLNRADMLQVIGRAGVGIDNIDMQVATLRGVVVMNTPDGNTISAAEHTLAMMLALARNIPSGQAQLSAGGWDRNALAGVELQGKTVGIIGLGRIGQRLMHYVRALGMQVVANDPYAPVDLVEAGEVDMVSLDELLRRADFVTLHVPRTNETANMMNSERLGLMQPSARLINCARGGLIDEFALAEALTSGAIAGAALDVFSEEPLAEDHPLRRAPNLVMTPHLGASTHEAQQGVALAICRQVADFLSTGAAAGALNMPVADMEVMKRLEPFLQLGATMGALVWQLSDGAIKEIEVTCTGQLEHPDLLALAAVRGVLEQILDTRLNFVNTAAVAQERGIRFTSSVDTGERGYANLLRVVLTTDKEVRSMAGSVFGGRHPRIVEIEGYHLELNPEGVMLFIRNRDAPGVLGRITTALGNAGVNIGEALLSRERKTDQAYLVIKVDNDPPADALAGLKDVDGILSIQKVRV